MNPHTCPPRAHIDWHPFVPDPAILKVIRFEGAWFLSTTELVRRPCFLTGVQFPNYDPRVKLPHVWSLREIITILLKSLPLRSVSSPALLHDSLSIPVENQQGPRRHPWPLCLHTVYDLVDVFDRVENVELSRRCG